MKKVNRKNLKISQYVLCGAAAIALLLLLLPGCSGFLDGEAFASHVERYTGNITAQPVVPPASVIKNSQGFFMVPANMAANGVAFQVSLNNHSGAEFIPELENDYGGGHSSPVTVSMNDDYSVLTVTLPPATPGTPASFDIKVNFIPAELRRPIKPVVLPKIVYKTAISSFYVDSLGGVDAGNYLGTQPKPFKTIAYALDYAAGNLDTLYLKAGSGDTQRYSGSIVIDGTRYKTSVTITTYGGGSGDIAKIVPDPGKTAQNVIEVKNGGNLTINSTIMLTGATQAAALYVHSKAAVSSVVTLSGGAGIKENTVSGASAVRIGNSGEVYCNNAYISYNTSTGNTQSSPIYVDGENAKFSFDDSNVGNSGSEGISYNTSDTNGGAIYLKRGEVKILRAGIERNTAKNGGAVYIEGGVMTLLDKSGSGPQFDSNSATETGGGAFYLNGGTVTAEKCSITYNSAAANGGAYSGSGAGVYIERGKFEIVAGADVAITSNTAFAAAGGVFVGADGTFIARSGTIQNNSTDVYVSAGRSMQISGTVKIDKVRLNVGANRAILVVDETMDSSMRIGIDTSNQPIGSDDFFVEFQDNANWTSWSTVFSISTGTLGQGGYGDGGKHALYRVN